MKPEIIVPTISGGLIGLVLGLFGSDLVAAVVIGIAVSALISFIFASATKDFNAARINLSTMPFTLAISGGASSFAAELGLGWSIGAAVFGFIVGATMLGVGFFRAEEQIEAAITSQELRKIDKSELLHDASADEMPHANTNTKSTTLGIQTPPKDSKVNPKDNVRMTPQQLPFSLVQILVTLSDQEQARIDALPFSEQIAALEKLRDTPRGQPTRAISCGHCKTDFSLPAGENGYCPKCNWLFINRY